MKYVRLILILVLAIASINVSAKKKKKEWPTDSAYIAHRRATIMAMDSVLKLSGLNPDPLMRFADQKCAEFNNDPELMRGFASGFVFHAGYIKEGLQRYKEIKRMYPKDFESYSGYAATLFDKSITVNPNSGLTRDPDMFYLAKAQMDSAKVAFPNDIRPYTWWIARCTFYSYNDSMQTFINNEVEALRKKFPDINADYETAKILKDKKNYPLNMSNFEHNYLKDENGEYVKDADGNFVDKWFFQAEGKRDSLTQLYYDKTDINTLSADVLTIVSNYYYESTEIKNITRAGRALLYKKGLERAALGMKKFPENDNFKYLQIWNAAELSKYNYLVANNSDSVNAMGEEWKWDKLELSSSYAIQALQAYEALNLPADSVDYKAVMYAAMAKQYSGKHEEAIQLYGQALNNMQYVKLKNRAPLYKAQYHDLDSLTAYQNISDCYKDMNDYEKAIAKLNAAFNLRKSHGGQLKRQDLDGLVKLYRPIGNDEEKTQQERFAAYVACDSLYAMIQDSIDAGTGNISFNITDGYIGMYSYNRLGIRSSMNNLPDYKSRENYLLIEMAEDTYRRIDPLPEKSGNQIKWIADALNTIWIDYYNKQDYKNALKYINMEVSYDPSRKEKRKKSLDALAKLARRQR